VEEQQQQQLFESAECPSHKDVFPAVFSVHVAARCASPPRALRKPLPRAQQKHWALIIKRTNSDVLEPKSDYVKNAFFRDLEATSGNYFVRSSS